MGMNERPDEESFRKPEEMMEEEMMEFDVVVRMPPKRRDTIKVKVKSIRKAEPRIDMEEYPWYQICD